MTLFPMFLSLKLRAIKRWQISPLRTNRLSVIATDETNPRSQFVLPFRYLSACWSFGLTLFLCVRRKFVFVRDGGMEEGEERRGGSTAGLFVSRP